MAFSFEESKARLQKMKDSMNSTNAEAGTVMLDLVDDEPQDITFSKIMNEPVAQAEEIFQRSNKYLWYNEYFDDKYSTVDSKKNITVNPDQINLTQETNSQYIPFEMPRYYDGIDLMKMSLQFHYINKDKDEDFAVPVNVMYSDNTIRFAWLVDSHVTAIAGDVTFEIRAVGVNERGDSYVWITKPNGKINIMKSLAGNGVIEPSTDWTTQFVTQMNEKVGQAQTAAQDAMETARQVGELADRMETVVNNAKSELETALDGKLSVVLLQYYSKTEVDRLLEEIDLSAVYDAIAKIDGLAKFNVTYDKDSGALTFFNGDHQIKQVTIMSDPTEEWVQTYDEKVDGKINTAIADIVDRCYEKEKVDEIINTKISDVNTNITRVEGLANTNKTNITTLGEKIAYVEDITNKIDTSPRLTYEATYDTEQIYTLWEIEGEGDSATRTPKGSFKIQGGGGGGATSSVLKIEYITKTPLTVTMSDKVLISYRFSGTDSSGDEVGEGRATWKIGNNVVATGLAVSGDNTVDLTDYITLGTQKVTLTITDEAGSLVTKTWTVQKIDIRLESTFNDTLTYPLGAVSFDYIPYGAVVKTINFKLDGRVQPPVSTTSSGVPMAYTIPAQAHGSHLFEAYITAELNGGQVESNHIVKDIVWYDPENETPVIGCRQQNITLSQYDTVNIEYVVYDPTTDMPKVTLTEDNTVISSLTLSGNRQVWQYRPNNVGVHTLIIECRGVQKIITVNVEALDIDLEPVTAGLVFDFNPTGKSNNDNDRLWSNGTVSMSVSDNFDWTNGGYQLDENGDQYFGIKAGTTATINHKLFADDAKRNGKEFKVIFKTTNVCKAGATFLSCLDENIGLQMNVHEAYIKAGTDELYLPYSEDDLIEFEFNISKNTDAIPMVLGYEDGIGTRPMVYTDGHNFTQIVQKDIVIGSEFCDVHIYRMKAYNTSLTDKGVANNFIADARNAGEMVNRYKRNQIYDENSMLTPEILAEKCPDLRIIKIEAPHFTNDKKDYVKNTTMECIYKNGRATQDNWKIINAYHAGQGTTSNEYGAAARNIDVIFCFDGVHQATSKIPLDPNYKTEITYGDGSKKTDGTGTITFKESSVPTNWVNFKVNVASSEMSNNALFQKRYNDYLPYSNPGVKRDPRVKNSMEFVNCVIFLKESDPDITTHREFQDTDWHFYCLGNMGDSKKTDVTRAYDPDDMNEFTVEISDNTLANSIFQTGFTNEDGTIKYPVSKSEWTEGNEKYDALYNNWDKTFEFRYDCCGDSKDGTPTSTDEVKTEIRTKNKQIWRDFYSWVITSTNEEFVAELSDWFIEESALYWYLFTHRYTMIDSRAKNTFWHWAKHYITLEEALEMGADKSKYYIIDNEAAKKHNGYRFDLLSYDHDTALGINNSGELTMPYGKEDVDYKIEGDRSSGYIFNAAESVFWCRIRDLMGTQLRNLYQAVDTNCWSAEHLINEFDAWQNEFPEELWRLHYDRLYLRTFQNGTPRFLNEMMNGRKKYQRRQWERDQAAYMGTKYQHTSVRSDQIMFRCNTPKGVIVKPDYTLRITPYTDMYLSVLYGNSPQPTQIRAKAGQEYQITTDLTEMDDTAILIYCASRIQALNDLSACYIHDNDFSKASRLQELVIGSNKLGYSNTFLTNLGIGNNRLLKKLDIQNTPRLQQALNLSACDNLEELYAKGSGLTGITFANGGKIRKAELPDLGALIMKNLAYLTELRVLGYNNLTTLVVENCNTIDIVEMLNNATNVNRARIIGVDWNLPDDTLVERIYNMYGIDVNGYNVDNSVLSGHVHIPVAKEQRLANYVRKWNDINVTYDTLINQYSVTFLNEDGTVLDIQFIDKGSVPVDPTTRYDNPIPIPTKPSTISTDYVFHRWDTAFEPVFSNLTIRATYVERPRQYTVKYVSKGVVLQTTQAEYGTNVFYEGVTPTYVAEESAFKYCLFTGWDQSGFVNGDKTINAVYDVCEYSSGYFNGKELNELRPVEIYAMIKNGVEDNFVDVQDGLTLTLGHDYSFDDIEEHVLIDDKTVFNGTNHVDTGVCPFDEDRSFVMAIDYMFADRNSNGSVLAQCYEGSSGNGFRLWYNNAPRFSWGTTSTDPAQIKAREMMVIRHIKGENGLHVYNSNLSGTEVAYVELSKARPTLTNASIVFGGGKADDGAYEKHALGTVYWSKIWYTDLGDSACKELASWTHEKINFEMCGFKRYYLSNKTSKRASMSFLASNLLSKKYQLNSVSDNAGGWARATLNTVLNTRLPKALSVEWRQLVKPVKINSSAGSMSYEITSSDCYFAIPSLTEMVSSMSMEPYCYEGDPIEYFTTSDTRICRYNDGTADAYWLRSPNVNNDSYYYRIQNSGSESGYSMAYNEYGVRLLFSIGE